MAMKPGDVINGRYRLLDRLGAGAHGVVFRARDLETRGEVALKVLGDSALIAPDLKQRMEREAVAMARLRGTGAVYVHGMATAQDGSFFVVMDMLYGQDFEEYLQAAEKLGGRIKAARLLEVLRPVATTLARAHEQGIVHRDLKPSNVFIVDPERGGGVRLLDFGLAKVQGATTLTAEGTIAGTPSYIAPETWRGAGKALDHRVDVYAFGVIVFRALSSKLPTPSSDLLEICKWATTGARPRLHPLRPSLPPSIDAWVARALAIFPEERFQSVTEAMAGLEATLGVRPSAPF
jgi:eukaryotic-like serine/threonine-protein kinase